jgi:hypothetical protein
LLLNENQINKFIDILAYLGQNKTIFPNAELKTDNFFLKLHLDASLLKTA